MIMMDMRMVSNNFAMADIALHAALEALVEKSADVIHDKIKDKVSRGSATPSAPGSPPRKLSGRLHRGVAKADGEGMEQTIGFTAPASHAHLLEFGTPHMAPRPFFRASFEEAKYEAEWTGVTAFRTVLKAGTVMARGFTI